MNNDKVQELINRGWDIQQNDMGCIRCVKGQIVIGCNCNPRGLNWCSDEGKEAILDQALNYN